MDTYWEYFLALESDLEKCSRYVEFSPSNYQTYSIEFARIIMAASSEFDTIAKEICKAINNQNASNINLYADIITNYRFQIPFNSYEVSIPRYNIVGFAPFEAWKTPPTISTTRNNKTKKEYTNPSWWTGYNGIKHNRTSNFNLANLESAIHSVGGLLVSLIYFHGLINPSSLLMPQSQFPKLLSPQKSDGTGFNTGGFFSGIHNPV